MQIKCDFCGAMVDETYSTCPNCGAPLSGSNRTASEQPQTIEQLKAWYEAQHLPPEEVTRFFIGKNITEPKAFGIYRDSNGDFVVYKNKSNGERAVRYKGADEKYAVNELYQRLKAEIVDQKGRSSGGAPQEPQKKKRRGKGCAITIFVCFILAALVSMCDHSVPDGYYRYQGRQYYHQGSSWYYYDYSTDDWYHSDESSTLDEQITGDNARDYQTDFHVGRRFEDTEWYSSGSHDDDSHWDTDSGWDSGSDSWDSGSTDWDSDW